MRCPTTSYFAATFHPTIGQLCSLISQHGYLHPQVGHDFHKEKGNYGLTHSQIHTKVQLSQSTVGFIRMLRQWKGRISKLVRSNIHPWTPTQYLSSLDSKIPTHPTQGSIPFTATQSLRPYLPFQFSLGCAYKISQPLLILCEVTLFTRFIKPIMVIFHS